MDIKQRFEVWWHQNGSGMLPKPGEDAEEHVKRVSEIAWCNGAYDQNLRIISIIGRGLSRSGTEMEVSDETD